MVPLQVWPMVKSNSRYIGTAIRGTLYLLCYLYVTFLLPLQPHTIGQTWSGPIKLGPTCPLYFRPPDEEELPLLWCLSQFLPLPLQRPSLNYGEIPMTEEVGQGVCVVRLQFCQQITEEGSGVNELLWTLLITFRFCNTLLVSIQSVSTRMNILLIIIIRVHTPEITSTTRSIQ